MLSKSNKDRQCNFELKLKLYSIQGVQEYWILDYQKQELKVYRRQQAVLKLAMILFEQDRLTTALLPAFSYVVKELFN